MAGILPDEYVMYIQEHGCFEGFTVDDAEPGYIEFGH